MVVQNGCVGRIGPRCLGAGGACPSRAIWKLHSVPFHGSSHTMASPPIQRKRPRLEDPDSSNSVSSERKECVGMAAGKTRVVLALCGSMSPITFLHLRMFGEF